MPVKFDPNTLLIKVELVTDRVKRRTYDATSRRRQSAETRQRILDAARTRITDHGYRATTIRAVAADAQVSVATVYELVGRKAELVRELVEVALSGTDSPVPGPDRDYVVAMRAEDDAVAKLRIYATATRQIHGRLAPLFLALRDAGTGEPDAGALWAEISDRRAVNMRQLATDLRSTGQLRSDLTLDEVAETLWTFNSPELYVMLTTERGWQPERFEHWVGDIFERVLLAP